MLIILPRFDRFKLMRIKSWFKETFRHHSLDEYREFFTRGMGKDEGENRVYPWIYTRLFLLCLVIFGFTAFMIRLTSNGISLPTLMVMGAFLMTAPFTVMLYELNPKKDLSLLQVIAVLIIGSLVGDIIIQLGYFAFSPENEWFSVLWTAFLEEFGKAFPAILAILLLKKRQNPMACFILAAAVGAGVSITEDLGYIYFGSGLFGIDLTEILSTSILRAVTSVCTHIVWSGFIGWAFGKFKRPLIDFRFWGMCLFSMALHFGWDLPSAAPDGWLVLTLLVCFILAIVVMKIIIKRERLNVLGGPVLEMPPYVPAGVPAGIPVMSGMPYPVANEPVPQQPALNEGVNAENVTEEKSLEETAAAEAERDFNYDSAPGYTAPEYTPEYAVPEYIADKKMNGVKVWRLHSANAALAVMLTVLSVLGIASCYLQMGYYQKQQAFSSAASFREFVQDGYEFEYDKSRKYDESAANGNYYEERKQGKLLSATQEVADGEILYYYNYRFYEDEDGKAQEELISVDVGVDGNIYEKRTIPAYYAYEETPGYTYGEIYIINSNVSSCWYDEEAGNYVAYLNEEEFYGLNSIIGLSVIAGLTLVSCGTACIINYVKAGKESD